LDPSTPEAQLNGIMAENISMLYEIAQAIYLGLNPNTSTGNMLDLVSQIRGVSRKSNTATRVTIQLTGTPGAIIPAGALFKSTGLPNDTFILLVDATIGGTDGEVSCQTLGALAVPPLTLTEIVTPVAGLDSVTNATSGVTGQEQETDEEFRQRSNDSVSLPALAIQESMYAGIINIDGVEQVRVLENTSDVVDPVTGISPHSMYAVVQGGADQDIAEVIFNRKSLGCGMDGLVTVQVNDINRMLHDIRFSRPINIRVYIDVEVTELPAWDASYIQRIKDDLIAFVTINTQVCANRSFDGYQMDDDVYASQLYSALLNENEFAINFINVGVAPLPVGSVVNIGFDELSTFDELDINVVSV